MAQMGTEGYYIMIIPLFQLKDFGRKEKAKPFINFGRLNSNGVPSLVKI